MYNFLWSVRSEKRYCSSSTVTALPCSTARQRCCREHCGSTTCPDEATSPRPACRAGGGDRSTPGAGSPVSWQTSGRTVPDPLLNPWTCSWTLLFEPWTSWTCCWSSCWTSWTCSWTSIFKSWTLQLYYSSTMVRSAPTSTQCPHYTDPLPPPRPPWIDP